MSSVNPLSTSPPGMGQPIPVFPQRFPATGSPARASGVARPSHSWLLLLWAGLLLATLGAFWVVPPEYRFTAMLSLANVVLTGLICFRLLRVNPVTGLVPCFFLIPVTIQSGVSTLYFGIFNPAISGTFGGQRWYMMNDNAFFQATAMACIACFALPWLLLQRADWTLDRYAAFRRAAMNVAMPTFLVFTACIASLLLLRILSIPVTSFLGYVVYGLFRYTHALPLVAGVAWADLPKRSRYFIIAVLLVNLLINTATNSRYYAFIPVAFFAAGVMFLSAVSTGRKYVTLVAMLGVVAVALVLGNAGRRLGAGLWEGGVEDLYRRYEILTEKSDQVLDARWGDEIFGRLFTTGGHQITTLMPHVLAFKQFDLPIYVAEVLSQGFLPRNLANALVTPYHEEKSSLVSLGHRITEKHSVERSFIGAAWELGGYGPLIVISLAAGVLVLLVVALVERQLLPRAPRMAAVCFAILCDSVLQSVPEGLPSMAHECIYSVVVGTGVYGMVWMLGNTLYRRSFMRLAKLRSDSQQRPGGPAGYLGGVPGSRHLGLQPAADHRSPNI
jgi:hypothetical protein